MPEQERRYPHPTSSGGVEGMKLSGLATPKPMSETDEEMGDLGSAISRLLRTIEVMTEKLTPVLDLSERPSNEKRADRPRPIRSSQLASNLQNKTQTVLDITENVENLISRIRV